MSGAVTTKRKYIPSWHDRVYCIRRSSLTLDAHQHLPEVILASLSLQPAPSIDSGRRAHYGYLVVYDDVSTLGQAYLSQYQNVRSLKASKSSSCRPQNPPCSPEVEVDFVPHRVARLRCMNSTYFDSDITSR